MRFPLSIALGASGGPERRTEIVTLGSGREERNSPWAMSRRRYNAGLGLRHLDDIHEVIAFFEARHGRLHGFRVWSSQPCVLSTSLTALAAEDETMAAWPSVSITFPGESIRCGCGTCHHLLHEIFCGAPVTGAIVDLSARSEVVDHVTAVECVAHQAEPSGLFAE